MKRMKINLLSILAITLMINESKGFMNCALSFWTEDKDDWYDLGSGYLLGIHSDNVNMETCQDCDSYGQDAALINQGLVMIEDEKEKWLDKSKITSMNIM